MTATSLLAVGREFDDAAAMLRDVPTLELGAHLALVGEDPPLLSAAGDPDPGRPGGAFPLSYRTVVRRGLDGAARPRRRAPRARRAAGARPRRRVSRSPTWTPISTPTCGPTVATVVADLAAKSGVPAVRLPGSHSHGPSGWACASPVAADAVDAACRGADRDRGLRRSRRGRTPRRRPAPADAGRRGPTRAAHARGQLPSGAAGDVDLRPLRVGLPVGRRARHAPRPGGARRIASAGFVLGGFTALTTRTVPHDA